MRCEHSAPGKCGASGWNMRARSFLTIATTRIRRRRGPCLRYWRPHRPRGASPFWARCWNSVALPSFYIGSWAAMRPNMGSTCWSAYAALAASWSRRLCGRDCRTAPRFSLKVPKQQANSYGSLRVRAMPSFLRVPGASGSNRRWKGFWPSGCHALLPALRAALAILQPVPRGSLHDLADGIRESHGPVSMYRAGPLAHWQAAPVSDRAVHPGGRSQVAPEEVRHTHHGRRADYYFDRDPNASVGGPQQSVCLGRAAGSARVRYDRIPGRLCQDHTRAKSRADSKAEIPVPGSPGSSIRRRASDHAVARRILDRDERTIHQAVQTQPADRALASES